MLIGSAELLDGECGLQRAVHDRRAQRAARFDTEHTQVGQRASGAAILLRKHKTEYTGVRQRLPQSVGPLTAVGVAKFADQAGRALGGKECAQHRRQISLVGSGQQFHDVATISVRTTACRGHAGQ